MSELFLNLTHRNGKFGVGVFAEATEPVLFATATELLAMRAKAALCDELAAAIREALDERAILGVNGLLRLVPAFLKDYDALNNERSE